MEKQFKGKSIYSPSGRAAEYAPWACNFYNGCGCCTYCYLLKGVWSKTLGGKKPELKKCFIDADHALGIFEKELVMNKKELQEKGLYFSFTTDPMLPETHLLTFQAIHICCNYNVPVQFLTKQTWWINDFIELFAKYIDQIAIGFTLTGHDEFEPRASPNHVRLEAMKALHAVGFKIHGSFEPVIDFKSSFQMICKVEPYCDLFKIGLLSGATYNHEELMNFYFDVNDFMYKPIYWKDGILKALGIDRKKLNGRRFVDRNYNILQREPETCEI